MNKPAKVVTALVLCPLAMYSISFMLPKRYTASMSLMLNPTPVVVSNGDPNGGITQLVNAGGSRSIATEIDKLTGSEVLLGAVKLTADKYPKAFADADQAQARFDSLVNKLRVDNNRDSDIIDVRVTMDDPKLAADTANNIGQAYMDYNKKLAAQNGSGALALIEDSLKEKQAEMDKIDGQIADIKKKYNMNDTSIGAMQDKSQKDIEAQIDSYTSQYNGAVAEANSIKTQLASTPQYLKTATGVQLNPAAIDLDQKISQASSDLQAARAKYTDDYPLVKQLNDKLTSLQEQRAKTPDNVTAHVETNLNPNYTQLQGAYAQAQSKANSLQSSAASLQASLNEVKKEGQAYPEAEKQLSSLTLQKTALSNSYATLVQQEQGIKANGDLGRQAPAYIVSTAFPPGAPSFPNPKVFMLMGLAVGIIISALIVMPKAPDVIYAPTRADALALDSTAMRAPQPVLPNTPEPEPARPAIESGKPEPNA